MSRAIGEKPFSWLTDTISIGWPHFIIQGLPDGIITVDGQLLVTDLNPDETARIEVFCHAESYPVLARLPHDPLVTKAMVQGLVVTELPGSDFSRELGEGWSRIEALAGLGR